MCYNVLNPYERGIPMDEREEMEPETESAPEEAREEKPQYVPRPRWQILIAWILVILMVIGVAGYYYWIAHKYT